MTDVQVSAQASAPEHKATRQQQVQALLAELLAECGIRDRFINFSGNTELISQQDLLAILAAQGVDVAGDNAEPDFNNVRQQLISLQRTKNASLLPPVAVFTQHKHAGAHTVALTLAQYEWLQWAGAQVRWHVVDEQGLTHEAVTLALDKLVAGGEIQLDDVLYVQRLLPLTLSHLPAGYHQLVITMEAPASANRPGISQHIPLILAPAHCYEPDWSAAGKKLWGFSVQLYSFCTERSWGMGDFFDLATLIRQSAAQGASYLILNPLHAGPLHQPEHCSPYSPVDRRRLNPLYIAPELVPEFNNGQSRDWLSSNTRARELLTTIRNSEWIDYSGAAEIKICVLSMMFDDFLHAANTEEMLARRQAFAEFKLLKGQSLTDYANWQAQQGCRSAGQFSGSGDFYCYLQWLAETQLADCQQQALALGMAVGLIRDLAVGSDRQGAEVSLSKGVFSTAASIGAPPDPLAPQGQNWGLPPLNPVRLRHQAYAQFIDLLRSNMQHSGALRIDHVMSLMRLWWCPYEKSGQGAYVMYPADDLFAILRLESQRQQCLIIGEDLGIVPDEVRAHLNESGIYSNLLFYFEKVSADSFRSPQDFKPRALAMLANHDVPTLAAWWNGSDLLLRQSLNLIKDSAQLCDEINHRQNEKKQILQLLESQWLLPADRFGADQLSKDMDTALAAALMRCISRSGAMMVSVQLEDLLLLELPVNIPGTSSEYKNWQRKMPVDLLKTMDTQSVIPMLESLRVER